MNKSDQDWWRSFHVIEMADLFLQRQDPSELEDSVRFLVNELQIRSTDHVYDQCCGVGTLSLALANKGCSTVGTDLCEIYIERAIKDAKLQNASCQFYCDDAYKFVPAIPCQAAFNWYSSYGYADSDDRNKEMLYRVYECLAPNGRFALDVPNFPGILRNFQYHLVRTGISNEKEVTCVRESQLDWKTGQLNQTWNWFVEGQSVKRRHSALRLYWPHQIYEALAAVGFVDIQMYGDTNKRKLDLNSPRLILTARKPE